MNIKVKEVSPFEYAIDKAISEIYGLPGMLEGIRPRTRQAEIFLKGEKRRAMLDKTIKTTDGYKNLLELRD